MSQRDGQQHFPVQSDIQKHIDFGKQILQKEFTRGDFWKKLELGEPINRVGIFLIVYLLGLKY